MKKIILPPAPKNIMKGVPLKNILDIAAISQLAINIKINYPAFDNKKFTEDCIDSIKDLGLKQRANKIAESLRTYLPPNYTSAINIIINSLTPPLTKTTDFGLSGMFYMPHVSFINMYGLDYTYNDGIDPYNISMKAQYELTQRFTAEFSMRNFIDQQPKRTFDILYKWMLDDNPHVRRLCSEGSRPRLPWASKLQSLVIDPKPNLLILETLKNDPDLYVRRSVANHLGDIAKDHIELVFDICEKWLTSASKELKWVIRHALRHPAKKQIKRALEIRKRAK